MAYIPPLHCIALHCLQYISNQMYVLENEHSPSLRLNTSQTPQLTFIHQLLAVYSQYKCIYYKIHQNHQIHQIFTRIPTLPDSPDSSNSPETPHSLESPDSPVSPESPDSSELLDSQEISHIHQIFQIHQNHQNSHRLDGWMRTSVFGREPSP